MRGNFAEWETLEMNWTRAEMPRYGVGCMWKFWIDTGGTFTDCIALSPEGEELRVKTLSSSALRGNVVERIDEKRLRIELAYPVSGDFYLGYGFRILGIEGDAKVVRWNVVTGELTLDRGISGIEVGQLCELQSPEEPPVLAARILTGKRLDEALPELEMRLATTRGTNALLELKGAKTAFIVTEGFGDLLRIGNQQRPDLFELGIQKADPLHERVFEVAGRMAADGSVLRDLDESSVREFGREALADGVESFAVALLHSYRNAEHETRVAQILREEGAKYVSVSSELSPFVKLLPRAETALVDAYLAPIMDAYLDAVEVATKGGSSKTSALRVMTSAGGLVSRGNYRPKDSLLSGPAGGVVGSSHAGIQAGEGRSIAFDMGGTSTDVSRFDGQLDYRFEQKIGAARVFAPSLRIETVAAGGGSICWFDGTALRVGPQSAGANPGPACYGAGGPLALTDVNLLLGRLDASRFGIPVFVAAAEARLDALQKEIKAVTGEAMERGAILEGFLAIANETMAEAIRKISTGEGYDPADYALVAFGGAGGLHACSVACILGMDTIVFPSDAGLLSAAGLRDAQVEQFAGRQILRALDACTDDLKGWLEQLSREAMEGMSTDGIEASEAQLREPRFELRFRGQESIITLEGGEASSLGERFEKAYEEQFGFLPEGLETELVAIRVAAVSGASEGKEESFDESETESRAEGGFLDRDSLIYGQVLAGPVVIQDSYSTVFVDTGWIAQVGSEGTLRLSEQETVSKTAERGDVVDLELFTNRFLSIVDEMGALLERAAFSTNVKDRKDFSCALLDPDGYLLANAPHIPVHLGALGVCLRTVLANLKLDPGDVVVTNHPAFGGSHLPDVTLLAPVYSDSGDTLLGYVANRAHHAELGGISPGSMPPNAKNLYEEGIVITPLKLVSRGSVNWEPLRELLAGGRYPSRSIDENVADLSAQLASIRRGQTTLAQLAAKEGTERVSRFMSLLKERAATALRKALSSSDGDGALHRESLDNGAEVCVKVSTQESGNWLIDFSGSADVQLDNYNATPAIATSAVIYVLRLLANVDVPLNEGFLDVVDIRIPEGMLNPVFDQNPEKCPAVVAGNVEVSQLVVSVLLKAFGLAACGQSTMNNLIFGTNSFGYYETIAGGEGASPKRPGASGVHTHMTNTAMTDSEVMELRYPVRVEAFSLRRSSGGCGKHAGGDGLVKRIRFLDDVTLSLLTQRRKVAPFGMLGGDAGRCGEQVLIDPSGLASRLPGNGSWDLKAGSVLEMRTPGGGAWGAPS
ncbi:hydantoinase B/oxoprolinase family protein [Pelagicoccus sp. SDUM812002]|uniref:hydantoinase B/oxoprolinase family protein n=1 Tax=Pelagicoccus sp. SDUM812002 TaxID=3041266 RepID=UPI00280F1DA4|nr:hydantoinase B/oxoprolinase family protein [Pelagicoccus sp. SDUM812002]MDQ8188125.1 hydantoinase B/oxoprolinase family protein [Pelagicoccus sp. SDUM812002]